MNPFLEIPQVIVNSEKEEKTVGARIQPSRIEYYYPGFHWGTVVVFKSGNSILTTLDSEVFGNALVSYFSEVDKNKGVFGNLTIKPEAEKLTHQN